MNSVFYVSVFIIFIIIFLVIIVGCHIYSKSEKYLLWQARQQWNAVRPKIAKIHEIHDRIEGKGEKIKWHKKKSVRDELDICMNAHNKYIHFCSEKNINPQYNPLEIKKLIDECYESLLKPDEYLDYRLNNAKSDYDYVYNKIDTIGNVLYEKRKHSVQVIENISTLINSISNHPKDFDNEIEKILIIRTEFKSSEEFGNAQKELLKDTAKKMGAGVATGAAVAGVAPSAAMWVATTFGTASTGTAISALNGAAATNAALAWLGGGSVAAGGGGMAAGQALLALAGPVGGFIAGGTVFACFLISWFKKRKIRDQKKEAIESLMRCREALEELAIKMDSLIGQTEQLTLEVEKYYKDVNRLNGKDYSSLPDESKLKLGTLVNNTLALSALINEKIG